MNPENRTAGREKFLREQKLKYNVQEPQLGFDQPVSREFTPPDFDPQMMTLDQYNGPWGDPQMTHLLRRTKFGVPMDDLRHFRNLDLEQSVDLLMTEEPEPAPPVNDYSNEEISDPDVAFGETWIHAPHSDIEGERVVSLKRWWIDQIIDQDHSITQKLLMFWHNHLVTEWWGVFVAKSSYNYMRLLRKHMMGDFKTLMKEITIDVCMLYYLNGAQNNKFAPDENYARELQELFCIGKGPNANFTEDDVRAAARVLTGWTVAWPGSEMIWENWRHDEEDKQFSEFYGNRIIEGRANEAGQEELDELIDMLFENNETALFLCRKLYTFFVYPTITDEVEASIIAPLAEEFRNNGYIVKPILEKLLKSQHFYDPAIAGSIIKDPVNNLLGIWRTLQPPVPYKNDLYQYGRLKNSLHWTMYNKGMELGDPPSVSGWPAYYQSPIYDKGWITTTTITSRAIDSDSIVFWGFWSDSGQVPADLVAFSSNLDNPEDPNMLLDQWFLLLLGHPVADITKSNFKNILLSGQAEDYYWTDAWFAHKNNPGNEEYKLIIENRLKAVMQRVLQLAESQLM